MRIQSRFLFLPLSVLLLALAGCNGGGGGGEADLIQSTSQALGGQAAIQGLTTQRIVASGQWFEPEQTFQPGDPPLDVSTFTSTLTREIPGDRFRFDWTREVTYPFLQNQVYSEVIDQDAGLVDGVDSLAGAATTGMPSVRVATIRKLHRLNSPLLLMRTALDDPASVETRPDELFDGREHRVFALTTEAVSPVRLFIDPLTFLPSKADTIQDDPYYGDTLYEVLYEDWRSVGDVMVPHRLTLRLTGLGRTVIVRTEERSVVENGVSVSDELFAIPEALQVPFDAADALRGELMAQWFLRRQAIGLPTYADQGESLVIEETQPGSGVFFVTGGSHNTLIVEMADHLIALEPPLYESRSLAVIAAAEVQFPDKPIRNVVVSHFHVDHGGGVRTYAAQGAAVVVGEALRPHFEAILAASHTLAPDALENAVVTPEVLGVPAEGLTFSDGIRTLNVVPVTFQDHAVGYVLSHLSGQNLVYDSGDLFSPPGGTVTMSTLPEPLRQTIQAFDLPVNAIAAAHGSLSSIENDLILLPTGFRPEGVAVTGSSLFVGSIPTGRVLRADIITGQDEILVDPPAGRSAIGLKVDGLNRLFVAGGATGEAYVYNAATGAELAVYTLADSAAGATFINDVIVTQDAAWFTDSRRPVLYQIPFGAGGALPDPAAPGAVVPLDLIGDFVFDPEVNNANGIAATPDGGTLIIVQSNTGSLFNVNPVDGNTQVIDLGAESVPNGDGILLEGQTLFVVQNRLNQLAVLTLGANFLTGIVDQRITNPAFDVPTTVAGSAGELFLPNARFGTVPNPDTAAYSVVRLPRPLP